MSEPYAPLRCMECGQTLGECYYSDCKQQLVARAYPASGGRVDVSTNHAPAAQQEMHVGHPDHCPICHPELRS